MKKILCVLVLLLMAMPAFAAPVVQGSNTFTYSAEIDEAVNPVDQTTGEQEYLSLSAPTITFKDLDTIFPDRLSAMAFTADYSQGEKTAIFPGVLALNFTKDQILAYPNGNVIMTALQNSSDPVQTLFQYFDPIIVVNGPDGNPVSYNIKSFLSFNFMAEDNWNAMTVTANIVLAGGYPKSGFFIEDINGYPFIFDTIVSETSQPKAVDGQIEFAFGLVPNGEALGTGITGEYPLMETDNGNGYVIFESPENYLDITEIAAMNGQPAQLSSGMISFTAVDDGLSFSIPYDNYPGVGISFVNVSVYMPASRLEELGIPHEDEESLLDAVSVKIGNYTLSPSGVSVLPDGSAFVFAEFVLVDNDFVSDIFMSGDTVVVFDGDNNGELESTIIIEKKQVTEDQQYVLGNTKIVITPSIIEDGIDPVYDITGTIVPATDLPMPNGIVSQITPTSFEGTYISTGNSTAMTAVLSLTFSRIDLDEQTISRIEEYLGHGDMVAVMNIIRPVLFVGDVPVDIYNYLLSNGRSDLISISGLLDLGITISLPVVVTDMDEKTISIGESALIISDGAYDGKFTLKSYLGVTDADTQPEPASFSFGGASIRTDSSFVTDPVLGLTPVYEITGSFAQIDETPMEGMSDVINALLFTGTHTSAEDNPVMTSRFELSFKRADIPESIAVLIEDEISGGGSLYDAVLNHVRPVLFMGDVPFDVYEYLKSVGQQHTISVSGYLDTGIYISFPVFVVDSNLSKVVFDNYGYAITVYDGLLDNEFTLKSYLGILEPTIPVQSSIFILNNSSFTVDVDMDLGDDTEFNLVYDITGSLIADDTLPVLENMSQKFSPMVFTGSRVSLDENDVMPLMIKIAVSKNQLPADTVVAIRDDMSVAGAVFSDVVLSYLRPVLFIGDTPFDVYEYLKVNNKEGLLVVSGSLDTGIYMSMPVYIVNSQLAKAEINGDNLLIYDGQPDNNFVLKSYIGLLDIDAEPVLPIEFSSDVALVTVDNDPLPEIGIPLKPVYDITGMFTVDVELPSMEGLSDIVNTFMFEGSYSSTEPNNVMPASLEFVVKGSQLPDDVVSAINDAISEGEPLFNAVFAYVRPILLVNDTPFDVYRFMDINGISQRITVSGSLDTGISIIIPVSVINSDLERVVVDQNGNGIVLYDGSYDDKFTLAGYIGVLDMPEPVSSLMFTLNGVSVTTVTDADIDDAFNPVYDITGSVSSVDEPTLIEGMSDAVGAFLFEGDYTSGNPNNILTTTLEFTVKKSDLTEDVLVAIKDSMDEGTSLRDAVLSHIRPVVFLGDTPFDVYEYLTTNDSVQMIAVSGSLDAGIYISIPIAIVDSDLSKVVFDPTFLIIYDGEENSKFTLRAYVGILEIPEPVQVSVFALNYSSLTIDPNIQVDDIPNFNSVFDVAGAFESIDLPALEGMTPINMIEFTGTYSGTGNNFMPAMLEMAAMKEDLPDKIVGSIRRAIFENGMSFTEAVLAHIHPVMMLGDNPFDIYEYLKANSREDLLTVSGSVDTGIYMRLPLYVMDYAPAKVALSDNNLLLYDGEHDNEFVVKTYIGILDVLPSLPISFVSDALVITVDDDFAPDDSFNSVYDITGVFDADIELPLLDGLLSSINPFRFEGSYTSDKENNVMPSSLEFIVRKSHIPADIASAIGDAISEGKPLSDAVFEHLRPVLFVGDDPFDVYSFMSVNGISQEISVLGSLDAGLSISVPVSIVDSDLAKVTLSQDGSGIVLYDGQEDGRFTVAGYVGVIGLTKPVLPILFTLDGVSVTTVTDADIDDAFNPVYDIMGAISSVELPLAKNISDVISPMSFEGVYVPEGPDNILPMILEFVVKGDDLSSDIKDAIDRALEEGVSLDEVVFEYLRPILFLGDDPFDVYKYLQVNQLQIISVSGSPDAGIYISIPIAIVDSDLSKVATDPSFLMIYDGQEDGKFSLQAYMGVFEQPVPVQPSVFTFNYSSLTIDPDMQVGDIANFNPVFDVTGTFESAYLPVLEGMVPVSSTVFTGTYSYQANSFMPAILEMAIMKNDLPSEVADSVRKAVFEDGLPFSEAVLAHIHPVMMLGDNPFDVYEYLKVNNKTDLLTVSGSVDTGIYTSLPVYVADAVPAKVTLGNNYLLLYDGEANGEFVLQFYAGILDIEQEEIIADKTFNFDNGSVTVTPSVEIPDSFNAVYDVTGTFAETTMPVLPSFAQNLIPVKFEGTYVSDADNNAMPSVMEIMFFRNDLPEEVVSNIESALENGFSEAVLSYVRPIVSIGNIQFDVYDYLKLNNGLDLMTVSGSLDTGVIVSMPMAIVDSDTAKVLIDNGVLLLYDGNEDGKFVASFCIGVLKHEEEAGSVPEVIISAQGISVKTLPSFETDASVTRISQVTNTALLPGSVWPGREGFTDAISVNGFTLSYDNTGFTKPGALPVTLSVSVTANELSAISSENYNKVIAGEPFFDHFHIFKMVGSEVYDLNTIGGESMFTVTGDPVQKLLISFNAVLVDAEEQLPVVVSGDAFVFYDGEADGELTDPLFIAAVEEKEEERNPVSVPYSHGSVMLTFDDELSFNLHPVVDVQGSISETTLSLMDKFIRQVAPVAFEGQYQSDTDNNAVSGIWEFIVYGSDLSENIVSAIKGSELSLRETVFEYIRPVILAGNIQFDVYDYLQTNGKTDLIGVAGSVDTGIVITVPFVVVDSPVYKVVIDDKYLVIYDGNADGKFVLKSYIGIMGVEEVEKPTVVLESPSLSLKTKPIDIPEDLDVEAIEDIEFEDAGYAEWPNKEGVLGGVSVGSFVGEYDHNLYSKDGAASITVSVSVTPAELKGMFAKGKERYDKMLSEWLAGKKERFLDYYHVYKQIGDEIYDLVLIGGKEVFSLQGDPTTKITISFPAVLIDGEDISPVTFNSDISAFIVYDGKSDGQLTDPLFVGAPETVPTAEGETPEEEVKHILPDNPAGPSTGHDDIGKWFKIFSLF